MTFLLGVLTSFIFMAALVGGFFIGQKSNRAGKPKQVEVDDYQKRRAEQLSKDFQTMWDYNVDTARGG